MNRRELFEAVGTAGAGLTLGGARLLAHDHGGKNGGADAHYEIYENTNRPILRSTRVWSEFC